MTSIHDKGNVSIRLSGLDVLHKSRSSENDIAIYQHPHLGRILVLNDEIQHVEVWAPLYHEPLIHLPLAFVETPRNVLILGGGSFFAAQEVLKYESIEHVLMIDHDPRLLDIVCEEYTHAKQARSDTRLELMDGNAFDQLTSIEERFDLVVNDAADLLNLENKRIFFSLQDLLKPLGICSDLIYRHVFDRDYLTHDFRLSIANLNFVFSLVFAAEYPGILHILTLWGENELLRQDLKHPLNLEQQTWIKSPASNPCVYFDPRFLRYHLYLPRFIKEPLLNTDYMNDLLKLNS